MTSVRKKLLHLSAFACGLTAAPGCTGRQEPVSVTSPTLSVASSPVGAESPFSFDGDITIRMTRDVSAQHGSAIRNTSIEYHLSYHDSAGVVIAELSAPTATRRAILPVGTLPLLNWSKIRRIRVRSDAQQAEILLANGHSVEDNRTALLSNATGASGVASPVGQRSTAEQRLKGLRSMISPFVRRTAAGGAISRPRPADAASTDSSVWVRFHDGVEVASFRRRVANRAAPGVPPHVETTLEVTNARVSGLPNLQP